MTPATLLAAALLFPAAALAGDLRPHDPDLGRSIAEQGNRALARIHADTRAAARHLSPLRPSDYAALPASLKLARDLCAGKASHREAGS